MYPCVIQNIVYQVSQPRDYIHASPERIHSDLGRPLQEALSSILVDLLSEHLSEEVDETERECLYPCRFDEDLFYRPSIPRAREIGRVGCEQRRGQLCTDEQMCEELLQEALRRRLEYGEIDGL